jgi:hypothetical protein
LSRFTVDVFERSSENVRWGKKISRNFKTEPEAVGFAKRHDDHLNPNVMVLLTENTDRRELLSENLALVLDAARGQLVANGHKGEWNDESVSSLGYRAIEEVVELVNSQFEGGKEEQLAEAGDVLNYVGMMLDQMGAFD